jgi:putative CocE/NonD family hydrolase
MTDPRAILNNPFKELGEIPEKKYRDGYTIESIYIPMRDGVKIAATICLPKEMSPSEKIPTVLTQTRYWRAMKLRIPYRWILDEIVTTTPNPEIITGRGFAFIITDVRGTGASLGTRNIPFSEEEVKDGSELVDWIISQPWSDGNIVSKGISYTGTTAEVFTTTHHPAIKAVIPGHGLWDSYLDVAFPGGVYDNAFMQTWSFLGFNLDINNPKVFRQLLPTVWLFSKGVKPVDSDGDLKFLNDAIKQHKHNHYVHEHAKERNYRDEVLPDGTQFDDVIMNHQSRIEESKIPMLVWCSWYDSGYVDAVIHRFLNLTNPMICILGDWNHGAAFPANQFFPNRAVVTPSPKERINAFINFFDTCIYADGIKGKVLYYYTLVEEQWKKTSVWPPKGHVYQRWYLTENLGISKEMPKKDTGENNYKINFRTSTGRLNRWWTLLGQPISYEDRAKMDEKMLCYTSLPFERDTEITGQIIVCIYLKSTHEDGALFVYLEDIDEEGKVTYITDGEFRVIHRKISSEEPPYKILIPYHTYKKEDSALLIPGEIAEIKFGLHTTSVLIRKGHRIRIAIAGHDKDTFKRYPEDGRPTITISSNKIHASYIDLPIIDK